MPPAPRSRRDRRRAGPAGARSRRLRSAAVPLGYRQLRIGGRAEWRPSVPTARALSRERSRAPRPNHPIRPRFMRRWTWDQQLPDADRPAEGQPVPCRRQLLEVGPARPGARDDGPAVAVLDVPHAERAARLQAEDRPSQGQPDAARRDRGLPARQERALLPDQVQRETGLELEIIQPEEEARLAVISCAPLVSTRTEQLLVVDIGGGSTELVWIDLTKVPARERPRAIMRLHSGFKADSGPFAGGQGRGLDLGAARRRDAARPVRRRRGRRRRGSR